MDQQARKKALTFSSGAVGFVGLLYVLSLFPPLAFPTEFLFDLVIWPLDGAEVFDTQLKKLVIATLGAVILLASYLIYSMLKAFHDEHHEVVEGMILRGVIGWYVLEAAFSLYIGLPLNLLLNIGFAGLFVVPILLGRRAG